ncbi:HD domain-containing protein [Candidatus Micrarchaeota archaeon]|nr:HD domain-containing protein [Candidatus Micrarchaeota archaeon]
MYRTLDYIFEAGMLKRVKRSGWWTEGINNPESVAEHSHRTAVVAFVLAKMEGLSDEAARRICTAAVFHDMHETRLLDLNKITARYIDVDRILEKRVEAEQVKNMPHELSRSIIEALELTKEEQIILKDADYLECAVSAKEYLGEKSNEWIENAAARIKTKNGKQLIKELPKSRAKRWLDGLKKF